MALLQSLCHCYRQTGQQRCWPIATRVRGSLPGWRGEAHISIASGRSWKNGLSPTQGVSRCPACPIQPWTAGETEVFCGSAAANGDPDYWFDKACWSGESLGSLRKLWGVRRSLWVLWVTISDPRGQSDPQGFHKIPSGPSPSGIDFMEKLRLHWPLLDMRLSDIIWIWTKTSFLIFQVGKMD